MSGTATERVMQYIRRQKLAVGDRLPAEVDISRMLGLSRNSLREAYADLMAKGLLKNKHGVGTFIANPPILNALTGAPGFWKLIENAGMKPSFREIVRGEVIAPEEIAAILGLAAEKPSQRLRWLFLANDQPCILVDHYLAHGVPLNAFNALTEHNALAAIAPFTIVDGASLSTRTSAINATDEIANLLQVNEGDALLWSTALVHSGDGSVPLASRSWMVPHLLNSHQVMALAPAHFQGNATPAPEDETK
ncbi:MAG TPA: GntR family transcriptional regulator [Mesorhizobium sp.]|jgi:GntR family transcriptional regulator|uniref:GntR family transcriptional regulator n=1 Tax=Mesorhizobium sp. TaxID=1871066 RepID=UPI002DDDBAC6|nr:GntR family transcriptional regulator [Mesorhizobium sp.]HEV2505184.1 GntR family transcriptional regulator [Mesorhizobium sp.]